MYVNKKTIYWSHRPKHILSPAEYEAKLAELKETGIDITASKSKKSDWFIEGKTTYHEDIKGKYHTLYIAEWWEGIHYTFTAVCGPADAVKREKMQMRAVENLWKTCGKHKKSN